MPLNTFPSLSGQPSSSLVVKGTSQSMVEFHLLTCTRASPQLNGHVQHSLTKLDKTVDCPAFGRKAGAGKKNVRFRQEG